MQLRTTTRHEDDVWPVLLWFATSLVAAVLSFQLAEQVFLWLGYTSVEPILIKGGGETSTVYWTQAEYYAGLVEVGVLVCVNLAWWVRNELKSG